MIGLYVNPPDHAAVFAVDEKMAIQALDRLDPVLPLSPGRAERHGFEYYRHGTLSLLAALDTKSGEVIGKTVPRHTSAAFVDFLGDIVIGQPKGRVLSRRVVVEPFLPPLYDDYDIHPDGRTVAIVRPVGDAVGREVTMVLNWFPELRRVVRGR